jgi:hypothetical protein
MGTELLLEPYVAQLPKWPSSGRHILAQFDEDSIVVYQAYRPEIGHFAAAHGTFGAGFSFSRMTWIKPNFLWMMFRSGWGTKPGQEVTLAIRIRRAGFDQILRDAVPSSFARDLFPSEAAWREALEASLVRLQWDPDHDPRGTPVERRAIQLGIRGGVLKQFASEWIQSIEDISDFVAEQRGRPRDELILPRERAYAVPDKIATHLGMTGESRGSENAVPGLPSRS